jgi:branched-subunit amino acid aminotransferase/4-amino-4-deoxychorismate lyase
MIEQTAESLGKPQPFDTILHWTDLRANSMEEDLVTETSFANIAIHVPDGPAGPEWITPEECALAPFLPGLMREELLKSGILREGVVRVRDLRRWAKEGRRMIGMNGLR